LMNGTREECCSHDLTIFLYAPAAPPYSVIFSPL
jgi:hypothetical protein